MYTFLAIYKLSFKMQKYTLIYILYKDYIRITLKIKLINYAEFYLRPRPLLLNHKKPKNYIDLGCK